MAVRGARQLKPHIQGQAPNHTEVKGAIVELVVGQAEVFRALAGEDAEEGGVCGGIDNDNEHGQPAVERRRPARAAQGLGAKAHGRARGTEQSPKRSYQWSPAMCTHWMVMGELAATACSYSRGALTPSAFPPVLSCPEHEQAPAVELKRADQQRSLRS